MITHFMHDGKLACGREGDLTSTTLLKKVKCRNCRNTEVFKQARRDQRNAARRASRSASTAHSAIAWRAGWSKQLAELKGPQRLPRGFGNQPFV
ncbi:hypothetical protein ACS8E9_10620 [Pseudomonas neustonica]|jgi:hypothetical protein|uniref:Uncharacterized protein n=1 Tax=Pseudomonas neustonica TaxID=2487346 RepID=A0ABX9XHY2_9PSED|nr:MULTISPECIES: hypothetical protein [Pseudomonas]MBA6420732.1 hypothetical protein [Pseudomonas sp. 5Ae-yellow]ROZ81410.1 hypothetical protein EF099_15055 [Pseudomonas sp. SSM44]ROZ82668.1 hypothetical protein EF096_14295 [Pseudomonas neustonica]|tara:strand:+ start:1962 stop:2243 length:282 start_codon:yes stop_codon:yes gene_type:complete